MLMVAGSNCCTRLFFNTGGTLSANRQTVSNRILLGSSSAFLCYTRQKVQALLRTDGKPCGVHVENYATFITLAESYRGLAHSAFHRKIAALDLSIKHLTPPKHSLPSGLK
jgi:hypothetical protein